ncbi:hypothetical protein BC829DRAFT_483319 [Chytridium lagenaria]|nr:hypothetical protein BC829DRAFT_483319 [Chytridium lagenaria]
MFIAIPSPINTSTIHIPSKPALSKKNQPSFQFYPFNITKNKSTCQQCLPSPTSSLSSSPSSSPSPKPSPQVPPPHAVSESTRASATFSLHTPAISPPIKPHSLHPPAAPFATEQQKNRQALNNARTQRKRRFSLEKRSFLSPSLKPVVRISRLERGCLV